MFSICYAFFNAVMEFRAGLEIGWMDPVSFAEMFLAGRAKSTFPTYGLAFRKLWFHGLEIRKNVFRWMPIHGWIFGAAELM